jgi:RimJ/RimL family protein N-acetyltransferase
MTPESLIRLAGDADSPGVSQLWEDARTQLSEARGGAALTDGPLSSTEAPVAMTWVHHQGPERGTCSGWREGTVGWLALWVPPEERGKGVGRQLAQAALDWLSEQGAQEFDALALPGDRATKQLLESLGFKARLLVMRREALSPRGVQ